MYSAAIVERNIAKLYDARGIRVQRYTVAEVDERVATLAKKIDANGNVIRGFSREEKAFIGNEALMSKLDFRYWQSRYSYIILDGGGLGRSTLWESQEIILARMAQLEKEMYASAERGDVVEGILLVVHKARQLGMTALAQQLGAHKLTTTDHIRGLIASVDGPKVFNLYQRFKRVLDNLPWYLKPSVKYDEKGEHIYFDRLDSTLLAQDAKQMSGLGQGEQWEFSHLTEVSSWPYPGMIRFDFTPTIPQSLRTLAILESTAQVLGDWWNTFTEQVREGQTARWKYIFVPWYAEKTKYRRTPLPDWKPSEIAMLHAQKVYETSKEFVGKDFMLPKEKLYWWETERAEAQKAGELNRFLANYCATPEESFQMASAGAFGHEQIEQMRLHTVAGTPYEIRATA